MPESQNKKSDNSRLQSIIKWPGGKERELDVILKLLPPQINNYYEPFVGGGIVYLEMKANGFFINDFSSELIALYDCVKNQEKLFFSILEEMSKVWNDLSIFSEKNQKKMADIFWGDIEKNGKQIDSIAKKASKEIEQFYKNLKCKKMTFEQDFVETLKKKFSRIKSIENKKGKLNQSDLFKNFETIIKGAFYINLRKLYNSTSIEINKEVHTALFFFIRNFAYSGMFRYNGKNEFNVPYGGIGYNKKNIGNKISFYQSKKLVHRLKNTVIENKDFENFLRSQKLDTDDFIFLDPPYDSEFSTYARNEFSKKDQERLAYYLINDCNAKWMLVIKHTDFIYNLYANKKNIHISSFDKKYAVSFMNRNKQDVVHLVVRNYV